MINHGFRRLALAHSLLPATADPPPRKPNDADNQPHADRPVDPSADPLDDDTSTQDHPSIHM
jgi:hypothetical protein